MRSSEGKKPQSLLVFSTRFERNAPPVPRTNASEYWNTSVTTSGKPRGSIQTGAHCGRMCNGEGCGRAHGWASNPAEVAAGEQDPL
jgi:hypothetical protein